MSNFWLLIPPLLATISFLSALAPMAAAEPQDDHSSYRDLVKQAESGDLSIDFRALRFNCLKAKECDPRGDSKDVVAMNRAMQQKEYSNAVEIAEKLISRGFPNIEAHAICAQAYRELNNPEKSKFHQDVTSGLIRSILRSGDGKTKQTSFEVIDTHEEYVMMQVLGLPVLGSQSLLPGKPHNYDYLERDDPKTGKKTGVYFNIDAFYPT